MAVIRDGNGGTDQAHVTASKELLVTGAVTVAALSGEIEVKNDAGSALSVTDAPLAVLAGAVTETAPASDTASSGLNGRLQRIAQRLTSIIALLPASLGQKTKANSLAVTLASDSDSVAVTAASLPLPAGAATSAKQPALGTAGVASTDVITVQGIASGTAQPVSAAALPLPTGAATEATLASRLSESDFDTKVGSLTETAPSTDTNSSGLNGRLQRIAQRLTSLIALLPASLGQKTKAASLAVTLASDSDAIALAAGSATIGKVDQGAAGAAAWPVNPQVGGSNVANANPLPISDAGGSVTVDTPQLPAALVGARLDVNIGASSATVPVSSATLATEATQATRLSESDFDTKIGSLTETAPASDTASSGLNGRLQRNAQRLTSLIGLFPTTIGQKAAAGSLAVVLASDQATVAAPLVQRRVPGATATIPTQVAASVTSVALLALNTARLRATIVNDSTSATLYVKEGATAATSSYTYKLAAGATLIVDDYTGRLDGIWSAAVGGAAITEVTP